MDESQINAVIESLVQGPKGWTATLPESQTFHGKAVTLRIDFPTAPTEQMLALARLILGDIDQVLLTAEREFAGYHEEYEPDAIAKVDSPRIWIDEDALLDDGPERWALVVGFEGREDYGTHIEFDGTRLFDIWSGD